LHLSKSYYLNFFFQIKKGDPLYHYFEYPGKVTALIDYKVVDVKTASECAMLCDNQTSFTCRSFNLCQNEKNTSFNCLLSPSNIHNIEKNSTILYYPLCSHYSSNN
jgi:hypothetical protein